VGTLEPRKNLRRLFAAYAALPPALRDATPLAVVGGGGWKHDETEATLRGHPELAGVRLLGRVDDAELAALYSAATVFAYPSLAEGFGLPVAEAMACGCPVLTSDCSSLPEVAGDAAVLVDPTDTEAITAGINSEARIATSQCQRVEARRRRDARSAARAARDSSIDTTMTYNIQLNITPPDRPASRAAWRACA
jgi:alpha-1,3-rhamnosyl/mannosyltransferase